MVGSVRAAALSRYVVVVLAILVAAGAEGSGKHPPAYPNFVHPGSVAVDAHGNVYVGDAGTGLIVELSPAGHLLREWRPAGIQALSSLAVDSHGNLYLADEDRSLITKLSPDGRVLHTWGVPGKQLVTFALPRGLALDAHDHLYVSDWGKHRIVIFRPDNQPLTHWAIRGHDPGSFWHPLGVAVDRWDHVFVVDEGGWRVQEFTRLGHLLRWWYTRAWPWVDLSPESLPGNGSVYGFQAGIAVDAADHVYVTNWSESSIREFTSGGRLISRWLDYKANRRQNRFARPSGIGIDRAGTVYVADWATSNLTRKSSHSQRFETWK